MRAAAARALLSFMVAGFLLLSRAHAGGVSVPSGQYLLPYEFLWEDHRQPDGTVQTWLILRFLAPEIGKEKGKRSFDDVADDLDSLCKGMGLEVARVTGGGVSQVIVNLMNAPIARGASDANVTQYMNAYDITGGSCEWQ